MLIHLIHDISYLIKLSFNTPKSTSGLDALSVTQIKKTLQSNIKNDNSPKRDDVFLIWSDTLPQLSTEQPPDRCQKDKYC
jgi:hypothetical protein